TVLLRVSALILILTFVSVAIFSPRHIGGAGAETEKNGGPGDEKTALIDSALYTRAEFFGAQALVPYPTAEARDRLAAVQAKYSGDPQIDLKLSQLDEKLGREANAATEMRAFVEHSSDKTKALETSAAFFERRAQFTDEAAALEGLLQVAPQKRHVEIFR